MIKKPLFKVFTPVCLLLVTLVIYLDLHWYLKPLPKDLEMAVDLQMVAAKFPSLSVLAFNREGVVLEKYLGFANVEQQRPASPETLYQVASVSKLVTAVAIMRLYEDGYLKLDDDINRYLPFNLRNPYHPEQPITIRHLLTHTSGINDGPDYWESYTLNKTEDPSVSLSNFLSEYFTAKEANRQLKDNFHDVAPENALNYSNIGFGLLGLIVERISGMRFNEFCQKRIFDVLDMPNTKWLHKNVDKSKIAMPYGFDAFSKAHFPLGYYSFSNYPDGALKTSTSEFMRFLYPFINDGKGLNGHQLLKPETVKLMLTPQVPDVSSVPALGWANMDFGYMHGGSDPGVATSVYISTKEQSGLIVFANSGGLQAWRTMLGLEIRDETFEYVYRNGLRF